MLLKTNQSQVKILCTLREQILSRISAFNIQRFHPKIHVTNIIRHFSKNSLRKISVNIYKNSFRKFFFDFPNNSLTDFTPGITLEVSFPEFFKLSMIFSRYLGKILSRNFTENKMIQHFFPELITRTYERFL